MEEVTIFDVKTPVIGSVIGLFDKMLSMEIETVDKENLSGWEGPRIAGEVSFAGEIVGSMMVQTTEAFARIMTAEMIGMELEEIEGEDEIKDVILEVSNIVAGGLKSNLNDSGLACVLSTPTLTIGEEFNIATLNMARYEKFAFRYQEHDFLVEVCLKVGEDAPPEAIQKLTRVDINKFKRLDIISTAGDTVIEVFDLMLSMKLELSDLGSESDLEGVRVVGSVNFAGEVAGSINIQVGHTFARIVTSKLIDKSLEDVQEEEEIRDVIGELCNIVGGNLKSGFSETGLSCVISPPSITVGNNFKIETLNMARYEKFAFRFYDHDIIVEVCVKIDENAKASNGVEADTATIDEVVSETEGRADALEDSTGDKAPVVEESSDIGDDVVPELMPAIKDEMAIEEDGSDLQPISPNMDFILDIPVEICVELGRTKMKIGGLCKLGPGAPLILSNLENEALDIFANNKLIAKGEVVIENEKYGIRVTEVISYEERIKSLGE